MEDYNKLEDVVADLKWFNGQKGFGFLVPRNTDNEIDAFVHITVLQDIGYYALGEGAQLVCDISFGDKGAIVTKIKEIITIGNVPESSCRYVPGDESTIEMRGIVKWYKQEEGFGFIIPNDGMKDVFIHKSCLEKNGIEKIEAGDKVTMNIKTVSKGREVISMIITESESKEKVAV